MAPYRISPPIYRRATVAPAFRAVLALYTTAGKLMTDGVTAMTSMTTMTPVTPPLRVVDGDNVDDAHDACDAALASDPRA